MTCPYLPLWRRSRWRTLPAEGSGGDDSRWECPRLDRLRGGSYFPPPRHVAPARHDLVTPSSSLPAHWHWHTITESCLPRLDHRFPGQRGSFHHNTPAKHYLIPLSSHRLNLFTLAQFMGYFYNYSVKKKNFEHINQISSAGTDWYQIFSIVSDMMLKAIYL